MPLPVMYAPRHYNIWATAESVGDRMPIRIVFYTKRQPYIPLDVGMDEERKTLQFPSAIAKSLVVLAFPCHCYVKPGTFQNVLYYML